MSEKERERDKLKIVRQQSERVKERIVVIRRKKERMWQDDTLVT